MIKTKLNLFSEFILSKLENSNSEIQLSDCTNFISIKGMTDSKELISIKDCVEEFNAKYIDYQIRNTIDLLEYKDTIPVRNKYLFDFTNFSLENNISYFDYSEFPFGFSISQGKLIYFYFRMIVEKLPPDYLYKYLRFNVEVAEKGEINFNLYRDFNEDEKLSSVIRDCFDFNIKSIENIVKKMDLEKLILNPNINMFEEFVVEDFILL